MAIRSGLAQPCLFFGALLLCAIALAPLSIAAVFGVLLVSAASFLLFIASLCLGTCLLVAATVDTAVSYSKLRHGASREPAVVDLLVRRLPALDGTTGTGPKPAECPTSPSCCSISSLPSKSSSTTSTEVSDHLSARLAPEDISSDEATLLSSSASSAAACERDGTCSSSASNSSATARDDATLEDFSRLSEAAFLFKYGLARCNPVRELGQGAAGLVELVSVRMQDGVTTRLLARKTIQRGSPDQDLRCTAEVTGILAGAGCPHVVRLLGCAMHADRCELLLEYAEGGSLVRELDAEAARRKAEKGRPPRMILSETRIQQIASGILTALHVYHSKGLVHSDVKPDNVLLRSSPPAAAGAAAGTAGGPAGAAGAGGGPIPLLADFDCCSKLNADGCVESCAGTFLFRSPEVSDCFKGLDTRRTAKIDIFSVGALLATCAAYHGMPTRAILGYERGEHQLPAYVPAGLRDFIGALTATDPDLRPTAAAALQHPFLQQQQQQQQRQRQAK